MSTNKDLWTRVSVTDPKAVKPITGKQYSGNSPKPYWIVERLTEEFGPCGIGWGFCIVGERFEHFGAGETAESLHIARVLFWYVMGDKRGELEQVGQTRAAYTTSKGKFMVDEDAPKKSVTDALVKCASYLGFAGDIFSGRWDDSKYVAWAREQYEPAANDKKTEPGQKQPAHQRIAEAVAAGKASEAATYLASLDQAALDAIWSKLDEATQTALTAAWPKEQAA